MATQPGPRRGGPTLETPVKEVLGGRTATRLDKAELHTVGDLLRWYPRRYIERGKLTDLSHLVVDEPATAWVRIAAVNGRPLNRYGRGGRSARHITTVTVTDGTRAVDCTFFNQPWLTKVLEVGMEAMVSGKVTRYRNKIQMTSPELATVGGEWGDIDKKVESLEEFADGIVPVYPQTSGVTSALLQRCVRQVLDVLEPVADPVPEQIRRGRGLIGLDAALRNIHRPADKTQLGQAQRRLRYDEALSIQLILARRRAESRRHPTLPAPPRADGLLASFDAQLPFELTAGQRAVGETIAQDLAGTAPMNRLLQGDVGSGKTVVALRAMLQVIDAGRQAVLLAPTEVLVGQHVRSLRALLGRLGHGGELTATADATRITALTGSASTPARRAALATIASGEPGIIVGTHALLSESVIFTNLGLVVVDEQHRFGVEQRDRLRQSADQEHEPHVLVMTATPIPRTVAMTVYGDLDVSTMTELPAGRAATATTVVPVREQPGWLERAWQRIREEVAAGHQAYVVCPKIGDDDAAAGSDETTSGTELFADDADERTSLTTVLELVVMLTAGPLAGLQVASLHGRMKPDEKEDVMQRFAAGAIDVLVSTTVIEVGVDVPNASVMVIMDAGQFGISQLHQLRGRIGRGDVPGVCLLVTDAPAGSPGRERLDTLAATSDGFELAEADLRLRREGDILGTSQAGRRSSLKLLSLLEHRELIDQARADAHELVASDPTLGKYEGLAALADAVVDDGSQEFLHKA